MSDVGSHQQPDLSSAPLAQADSQPFFDFSTSLSQPQAGVPISAPTTSYDPTSFLSFPASLGGPSAAGTAPTPSASVVDATQFGSEAAGYEYAILNAMLNGNGFALDTHTTPTLSGFGNSGGAGAGAGAPEPSPGGSGNRQPDPMLLDGGAGASGAGEPSGAGAAAAQAAQAQAQRTAFSASPQPGGLMTAEEAYRSVTKPYPYAQSYHFLVKHLKQRCVVATFSSLGGARTGV